MESRIKYLKNVAQPLIRRAQLIKREEIAKDFFEITLRPPADFNFAAGQYAWLIIPLLKYPDEKGNRRAFSIVSSPSEKNISFCFRPSESGFKRTLAEFPLPAEVEIAGPFGSSFVAEDADKPIILIAGGVGVAPFLSIIRDNTERAVNRKITLYYFNEILERAGYLETLEGLQKKSKHFFLRPILGGPRPEVFREIPADSPEALFYISGPEGFVTEVEKNLLDRGVKPEQIHFEENWSVAVRDAGFLNEIRFAENRHSAFWLAAQNSASHIVITDLNGKIIYANPAAEIITAFTAKELIGQTPRIWGGLMQPEFYKILWRTIKHEKKVFRAKVRNRRKNGELYTAKLIISPIIADGKLLGYVANEDDITKEEEIAKAKTDFIALASHQLRSPLSSVKWLIEMFQESAAGALNKEQKKYLDQIYGINEQMIKLMLDMLDVFRIESGALVVKNETVSIPDIIKKIFDLMEPAAQKRKINIRKELEGRKIFSVETDPKVLQNILECFIANAINYSSFGQEVNIAATEKDGDIIFSVRDSGIGIPKEERKHIFERFYRASNAKQFNLQGTGLGLYIAAMLAEKIGSNISFESEEGKGSIFYLRIPQKSM